MLAHEKLHWCFYVVLNSLFKVAFLDIFYEKFTYSIKYVFFLCLSGIFMCGSAYSVLYYDIDVASNAMAFLLLAIQITIKYLCAYDLQSMVNVADHMIDIYKHNSADVRKDLLLERYAAVSKRILKSIMIFYCFCASMYLLHPIAVYVLHREMLTPLPTYFPFINERKPFGFIVLVIYDVPMIIMANAFHCAFHAIVSIVFVNMLMMSGIFDMHVNAVNEHLELDACERLKLKRKFIHLIREYQTFSE